MGQQAFDPEKIQIETGIPIPKTPAVGKKPKWLAVLNRMQIGQSIKVSREHRTAICRAAFDTRCHERKTVKQEKIWVRAVDLKNGEVRIWRIAQPTTQP